MKKRNDSLQEALSNHDTMVESTQEGQNDNLEITSLAKDTDIFNGRSKEGEVNRK